MRKTINKAIVEGALFDHTLEMRTTGENSKHPGTEYIRGSITLAVNDEATETVSINFIYTTPITSSGKQNPTYNILKSIIETNLSIAAVGKENAKVYRATPSIALNEWCDQNDIDKIISYPRYEGGFVSTPFKLAPEDARNTWEADILINGFEVIEPDDGSEAYGKVNGAIFNFRGDIIPMSFILRDAAGIQIFSSLDPSPASPLFRHVWGKINTVVVKRESEPIETAFGQAIVDNTESVRREFLILGMAAEDYPTDDATTGISPEEIKQKLSEREVRLSELKQRTKTYRESQNGGNKPHSVTRNVANLSPKNQGFNF